MTPGLAASGIAIVLVIFALWAMGLRLRTAVIIAAALTLMVTALTLHLTPP